VRMTPLLRESVDAFVASKGISTGALGVRHMGIICGHHDGIFCLKKIPLYFELGALGLRD
jgi:hypothetical protein